jgi:hypothetical protein
LLVIWIFKSVQILYKFNVSSWKMIKILSHHQKKIIHILLFYYTLSYNFFSYIMYIITHLYVVKNSWNFEILKQYWNIFWIFKVLEFHIFKSMMVFWVWLICFYHLYFFQWIYFIIWVFLIVLCKIDSIWHGSGAFSNILN